VVVVRAPLTLGTIVAALGVTGDVLAQDKMAPQHFPGNPEVIIYRDAGYRGPAVNVSYDQPNMGLAWTVSSIRVSRGTWLLCERPSYGGRCTTFTQSSPNIGAMRVQSLRPISGGGPQPPRPPPIGGAPGPSLKGMASEFFTQPSSYGRRLLSCPNGGSTANCARQTAEVFCRARGYNYVGAVAQQTVNRRVYLADVLCRTSLG